MCTSRDCRRIRAISSILFLVFAGFILFSYYQDHVMIIRENHMGAYRDVNGTFIRNVQAYGIYPLSPQHIVIRSPLNNDERDIPLGTLNYSLVMVETKPPFSDACSLHITVQISYNFNTMEPFITITDNQFYSMMNQIITDGWDNYYSVLSLFLDQCNVIASGNPKCSDCLCQEQEKSIPCIRSMTNAPMMIEMWNIIHSHHYVDALQLNVTDIMTAQIDLI